MINLYTSKKRQSSIQNVMYKYKGKFIYSGAGIFLFFLFFFSPLSHAEWNGEFHHYESDVYIKQLSTGQINNGAYFCAALYRDDNKITDVCSLSTGHMWSAAYDTLYNQAMYYYTTGQKIRVYYVGIGLFYPDFAKVYGDKILTGFATCESGNCFGPNN